MKKALVLSLLLLVSSLCAQWFDRTDPKIPRTSKGKLNLTAPTPRAANGKPDLSGAWSIDPPQPGEIERLFPGIGELSVVGDDPRELSKYFIDFLADFNRDPRAMKPAALELFGKHLDASEDNPSTRCLPQGIPRANLLPVPFKIIQMPAYMAILYEVDSNFREVYMDGRKLPVDPLPSWLGYSVGRWEGDTLVVDTAGFNDRGWLDAIGHPRSEGLRIQERFHRRDYGHMDLQITVEDPEMYNQPITVKVTHSLVPSGSLLETVCNENEKDRSHMNPK